MIRTTGRVAGTTLFVAASCGLVACAAGSPAPGLGGAGGMTTTTMTTSSSTGTGGTTTSSTTGTGGTTTSSTTDTGGTGGTGTGGTTTSSTTGTGGMGECTTPAECPGEDTPCQTRSCTDNLCGVQRTAADTPLPSDEQVAGDCQLAVCDGNGGVTSLVDDVDEPDDGAPCTIDTCVAGQPTHTHAAQGTSCGAGLVCDGAGHCVGCLTAATCPGQDTFCQVRACTGGTCGSSNTPAGTPLPAAQQTAGNCRIRVCDGSGDIADVADDADVPTSANACTSASCSNGAPTTTPVAAGAPCNQNGGAICNGAGACVECVTAATCPGQDTACRARTCTAGVCGLANTLINTPLPAAQQTAGDCQRRVCDGSGGVISKADDTDAPASLDDCVTRSCAGGAPTSAPVAAGTACDQVGGTVCNGAGRCVECLTAAACPGQDTACRTRTCTEWRCSFADAPTGAPLPAAQQAAGDCRRSVCDGSGSVISVVDDTDAPTATAACVVGTCSGGSPGSSNAPAGAACNQGTGTRCDGAGNCVQCLGNADCAAGVCINHVCETRTVLLLAGGFTGLVGAELHPGGTWSTTPLGGATVESGALAFTSDGRAIGVINANNDLRFTTWTAGTWAPFSAPILGPSAYVGGPPSLAVEGNTLHALFSNSGLYQVRSLASGAWSTVSEAAGSGTTYAAMAMVGSSPSSAFGRQFGSAYSVVVRSRGPGSWATSQETILSNDQVWQQAMTIASLSGGSHDAMVAYGRRPDGQIRFATHPRNSNGWSPVQSISGAVSLEGLSIAALPGGQAVLAYRSQDGYLLTSFYAGGWSPPAPIATPSVAIAEAPAVAPGIGGATAELAFIGTDRVAYHARFIGGAWTTPVAVGGTNLYGVAIASSP